jgi:hypothetical protein
VDGAAGPIARDRSPRSFHHRVSTFSPTAAAPTPARQPIWSWNADPMGRGSLRDEPPPLETPSDGLSKSVHVLTLIARAASSESHLASAQNRWLLPGSRGRWAHQRVDLSEIVGEN